LAEATTRNSNPEPPGQKQTPHKRHPMLGVLAVANFRWLWVAEATSVLGTQFYLIALPWLVLKLTQDPFAVGTVLATAGIPRALFILLGGALTDRFSPKRLLLASNFVRTIIVGLLTVLVLSDHVSLWMLYVLALTFGLADAFFFPAQMSIMPRIISPDLLLAGNSLAAGTVQLSIAVGPALAGLLIAVFSGGPDGAAVSNAETAMTGIGLAFGINAICFLASVLVLLAVKLDPKNGSAESPEESAGVLSSIAEGLKYIFTDKTLRLLLIVTAAANFFIEGPIFVGVPVLAETRFAQGAAAFGAIISAFGAGLLMGTILAGTLPRLPARRMGMILLLMISATGLLLILFGFAGSTEAAAAIVLAIGAAQGFVVIQYTTWIQSRTPSELLGRVFSMMMFASVGLIPISQALTGVLIKVHTVGLFVGAGGLMTVIIFLVAIRPEVRSMGMVEKREMGPALRTPDSGKETP